jgi:hypothetical protein
LEGVVASMVEKIDKIGSMEGFDGKGETFG